MDLEALAEALSRSLSGRVERARSLAPLTTYRLGGRAALYVEPDDLSDLEALAALVAEHGSPPILVLGRGSNVVVSDQGWPGLVVHLGAAWSWIRADEREPVVTAGAAVPLPQLANWTARRGLSRLEFTIAIPGSVGGAVRMNAGAHGGETSHSLVLADVFRLSSGTLQQRAGENLGLSYRRSDLRDDELVVSATFELEAAPATDVRARIETYRRHRAATQPGAASNAGSVFKNPSGDHAGRIVEAAGLKGFRIGGAAVSELHANFFIASAGATSQNVFDLVKEVQARVADRFGISLEPEIRFAGSFDDTMSRR